jgi:hypothetical protein
LRTLRKLCGLCDLIIFQKVYVEIEVSRFDTIKFTFP